MHDFIATSSIQGLEDVSTEPTVALAGGVLVVGTDAGSGSAFEAVRGPRFMFLFKAFERVTGVEDGLLVRVSVRTSWDR